MVDVQHPARPGSAADVTGTLEPKQFWQQFATLTGIARPSRHEERVAAHVTSWATAKGLDVAHDEIGNMVIRVPATTGRESAPTLTIQGHLDMVCERQPDSPYDPTEGRIGLVRDGEWLTADGTTLGADDGVAIAAMMALVDDPSLPHGPLELLMTVREEVGLEGVQALDGSMVTGDMLLNLDSEEDGRLTVGCAGSTDTWLIFDPTRDPTTASDVALTITISGGKGGHSGTNIAHGRSNAVKALGRVLREALATVPFRLVSLEGGKSRNAIPRDAHAVCVVEAGSEATLRSALETAGTALQDAYRTTDPGVRAAVEATELPADAWTAAGTQRMLDVVAIVPTGPLSMSSEFDGLVEVSSSLGEALTDGSRLTLHSLTRTSNGPLLADVMAALGAAARLADGKMEVRHNYGAWRPDLTSPLLATTVEVYREVLGEEPIVTAVHAGLECAVIGDRVAKRPDMLSFGPQIEFPHSPDERVSVPTVERFWKLLVGVVDAVSRPAGSRS